MIVLGRILVRARGLFCTECGRPVQGGCRHNHERGTIEEAGKLLELLRTKFRRMERFESQTAETVTSENHNGTYRIEKLPLKAIYFWRSEERPLVAFDARKEGLGRWLCSTEKIFGSAWKSLGAALPSGKRVTWFEAKPHRLYRLPADGVFEVEPVADLPRRKRPEKPATDGPPWWESEEERRARGCAWQGDLFI